MKYVSYELFSAFGLNCTFNHKLILYLIFHYDYTQVTDIISTLILIGFILQTQIKLIVLLF